MNKEKTQGIGCLSIFILWIILVIIRFQVAPDKSWEKPFTDFTVAIYWIGVALMIIVAIVNNETKISKKEIREDFIKESDNHLKESAERLKKARDKVVSDNNDKYKIIFSDKYENARINHEVQYTGVYRIPIADYNNYDLNIHGLSFFIDNIKSAKGHGEIEVRHNSFEDDKFDSFNLEIIDGFAILDQRLKNKNITPRQDYSSTFRPIYLTIRENSFKGINTSLVHNVRFTPYSIYDWK